MSGKSNTTTDHETIRHWAESRGGKPACVKGTGKGEDPGILRIEFPGQGSDDDLQEIRWEEFFKKFDSSKLAFLYQNETANGKESRFFKLISR